MNAVNLLIVDDELLPIQALIEQLKGTAFAIEYETRGEKALAKLQENPNHFDIVLVDRMMFGMDGMALLKAMKADSKLKNIPFIMQTGEAEPEEIEDALAAGAEKVVFKPFKKEDLLACLNEALNTHEDKY